MEYTAVKINQSQMESLFTPTIQGIVENSDAHVFVGVDNGNLAAKAVVTSWKDVEFGHYILNHLEAAPGYGMKELTGLVDYISSVVKDAGVKRPLSGRLIGELESLRPAHDALVSRGYVNPTNPSHYMMYYLEDIKDTPFVKSLDRVSGISSHIQKRKKNIYSFVVEGETLGSMKCYKIGVGVSFLSSISIRDKKSEKVVLPRFLAYGIKSVLFNEIKNEAILIQTGNERIYRLILNNLGEPESDETIMEYLQK